MIKNIIKKIGILWDKINTPPKQSPVYYELSPEERCLLEELARKISQR